jgi:hypothetical protein
LAVGDDELDHEFLLVGISRAAYSDPGLTASALTGSVAAALGDV